MGDKEISDAVEGGKRRAETPLQQPKNKQTKHRQQAYRNEWENDPSLAGWLKPVAGCSSKAWCRCCDVQMLAELTVLKNHAKSKKHQEKSKILAPTQKSLAQCLGTGSKEKDQLDTAVKKAELKLTGFLAEHNIALRAADHLVDLQGMRQQHQEIAIRKLSWNFHKAEYQGGDMATSPCEQLEQREEGPDVVKELLTQQEDIHNHLKQHNTKDAKIPTNQEEVNGSTNGLQEEQKGTLHIVEKDLDEFVDSMSEATTSGLPKKSLEAEKHPLTEMATKLPRAEQVAAKVLRAERVVERAQRVEKPPVLEKAAEKVPRVEKAPQAEKPHLTAPKFVSVKRKTESRAAKDTLPWENLSLNKCILVATFLALLSVSCQVVQEVVEYGGAVLEAELSAWTTQEDSPGEQEQLWFYERWFDWSDMDEPPEIEEEEKLLEVEEELVEVEEEEKEEEEPLEGGEDEEEETEPVEIEEEEEEEEETEEKPAPKVGLRKIQEKIKRETPSKNKSWKDRKAQEDDEEKQQLRAKRHRWEGKGKEKQQEDRKKTHRHKHGETAHPLKQHKEERPSPDKRRGHPKDEHGKGRGHLKHEKDTKDRKPWQIQKPLSPPPKDSAKTLGRPKSQEWKRHD